VPEPGRITATPPAGGVALDRADVGRNLDHSAYVELTVRLRTTGRGGVFFDAYPTGDFKFVALDVPGQRVIVGHYTARKGLVVDASAARTLVAGTDYSMLVVLKGAGLSVSVDGAFVLSYGFNAALADGGFGLIGAAGQASFDSFRVRSNDPSFTSSEQQQPTVSVEPTGAFEGGAGTTRTVTIRLTLSQPAAGGETVQWMTADGSATAGSDYIAASGTVTFAAGATSATVAVTVSGDGSWEPDETFTLVLANPSGLLLGAVGALIQIVNDDAPATVTITAPAAQASEAGPTSGRFVVTRSDATNAVDVALTWGGTAIAGSDYVVSVTGGTLSADRATLTFAAGSASATITITPVADTAVEAAESVTLAIAPGEGYQAGSPASATVSIADGPPPPPTLSVQSVTVSEGNSGRTAVTITVRLSVAATTTVRVTATTRNGTATAGSDYVARTVTLTFNPGVTAVTFTVDILGDRTTEADETFFVDLSNATGATVAPGGSGTVTIRNDDGLQLMASAVASGGSAVTLTRRAVATVLRAAVRRWVAAGVRRSAFAGVRVRIARLGGAQLARVVGRTIVIDADAAGWGWHVRLRGRVAAGRMDLLTVLLHELGHVAGLHHADAGVMDAILAPGQRRAVARRFVS
jgi:hypothetical protein